MRILLLLFSLACIAGFVRLGIWQLERADYKESLLAHSRQVLEERRADLLAAATDAAAPAGEAEAYEWAAGAGHFLPQPVIRLDNQVRNGIPGIRIYRVFQPDGARRAILVELGWRPLPSRQEIPAEPAAPDLVQVRGMLSPPPVAGLHVGGAPVQRQPDGSLMLVWLDPEKVAAALKLKNGLSPRVLRLDPSIRVGYKRDLAVLSGTLPPEQHRGYAVQWFGMAIALLVTTLLVARRKSRPTTGEEAA